MSTKNISKLERWVSALGGIALGLIGLRRRSLILSVVGLLLAKRGISGHSRLYARIAARSGPRLVIKDAEYDGARRYGEGDRDIVDEASWESFPASDAPAYGR